MTLKIHNVSLHLRTRDTVQKTRIPFEWRNPGKIPEKVEIKVVIKSPVLKKCRETLVGFNTTTSMLEFLTHRNSSSFYFPRQSPIYTIPYWEFSKDAALYQAGPNTTVKSITWPTELPYWHSLEGQQYLISQIRKIDLHRYTTVPTRIAISPFELDVPSSIRRLFLEEMEIHSRLGVSVRVISPRDLSKFINDKDSIALYGDGLGLDFHGIDAELSAGTLSLMLDTQRIRDLGQIYREIYMSSTAWMEYKDRKEISFSDEASGIAIFNRLSRLKTALGIKQKPIFKSQRAL